jgi:uncharacterized membrane protein YfcA
MIILGLVFIFFVGVFLGALGAGGAIFSIPVFLYLFKLPINDSIGLSYLIVSITALIAVIYYFKDIRWHKHTYFFMVPAIFMTWIMRHSFIPFLEHYISSQTIDFFLMIILSCLMFLSALAMFKHYPRENRLKEHYYWEVLLAMIYGSLVGSIGSAGGFLLIPTFRLLIGMHMTQAVATSLSLVSLTSLFGFEANIDFLQHIPFHFILLLTLLSISGMIVGIVIHDKCQRKYLELFFIWALVITATAILINQLLGLQFYLVQ